MYVLGVACFPLFWIVPFGTRGIGMLHPRNYNRGGLACLLNWVTHPIVYAAPGGSCDPTPMYVMNGGAPSIREQSL